MQHEFASHFERASVLPAGSVGEPLVAAGSVVRPRWLALPGDAAFLRAEWEALARVTSEVNGFYEPWALAPALKALGQADSVRLFTLWARDPDKDGDRLVGLMPVGANRRHGRWPLPHWSNWLHANAFMGGPLVAPGHERAFWRELLAQLDAMAGGRLFLHVEKMAVSGPVQRALEDVAREQGRPFGLVHSERRAFIRSLDDPEAYFAEAVRGKKRKELRRQKRRLEEMGALTFERFDGAEAARAVDDWAEEFLWLEMLGWKGENGSALGSRIDTETMFRDTLRAAAFAGRLQLVALRLDGRALAMLVNFLTPPGAFAFKTAYDEDYARFSPGVLLQEYNLGLMTRPDVEWCDSCAAEDHPMIDGIWRDRRVIGRYSVGIGGSLRRGLFAPLLDIEKERFAARRAQDTGQEDK